MGWGARNRAVIAGLLACALVPAAARAATDCAPGQPAPRTILSGQGVMESIVSDARGRLFYTHDDVLWRLDGPGATPKALAPLPKGGGLVVEPSGTILAGYGDGAVDGLKGNLSPTSGILRVDPETGATTPFATGLSMANGVARGPDGTVYASDDVGLGIDRVVAGKVEHQWAPIVSSNGLAVDRANRYLYANQTFVPAAIARIDLRTGSSETFVRPGIEDIAAGLDGMTIDEASDDTLYVAANGGGQVWRVTKDRRICALAKGLLLPSAVAFGGGTTSGFPRTSLFAVTFSGDLLEIPNVRPALPPAKRKRKPRRPRR